MVETVILVQTHNENNHLCCKVIEELAGRERKSEVSCGNYLLFLRKRSDTLTNDTKQKKEIRNLLFMYVSMNLCSCVFSCI